MAVSSYLRECEYQLGGLLGKIYLIHKNALKLAFKAKGIEVSVVSRQDGDIYVLEGSMVQFKQDETHNGKYRFTSTLEITINEQYKEPFFYGLRTLRTNQYYIIIEDKKGVQYLINPELFTKMTYEYAFSDENENACVITYNNVSNYPLLIFEENIEDNKSFLNERCVYNYGRVLDLLLFDRKLLKVKDDGCKAEELYIDGSDNINKVDHMKESLTFSEQYDGKDFISTLSFSIPLNDKYGWAYNLIEEEDNRYKAILKTSNDNYIIIGNERGLQASYTIETSEDDSTPNVVKIKLEQRSQYPILYTDELTQYRWVESDTMCFGYDRYQMLIKEKSENWGDTWVEVEPIVKKKGKLIESGSEECKTYQWVDDELYCRLDKTYYEKWIDGDEFICDGGDKYAKAQKYISDNDITYKATDEYSRGKLIEENSKECEYVAVRWVDDGYICYEVNEELNKVSDKVEEVCSGTTLMNGYKELVTNDGEDYFESGEIVYDVELSNCCECGYREEEWQDGGYVCGKDITPFGITLSENPNVTLSGNTVSIKPNFDLGLRSVVKFSVYITTEGAVKCKAERNIYLNECYIGKPDEELSKNEGGYFLKFGLNDNYVSKVMELTKGVHCIKIEAIFTRESYSTSPSVPTIITFENMTSVGDATNYSNEQYVFDDTTLYSRRVKHLICTDGRTSVDETTTQYHFMPYKENCYECGLITYQWRYDEYVCGSEVEKYNNITEVDEAPEINVDFE